MKIKINKGKFGIPMVVRQSFRFNTRYGFHQAEVVLTKEGEYSMTIDGSYAYSMHEASAKRSPLYKDAIAKASAEMQRAFESYDNAFVRLAQKTMLPKLRKIVETQLSKLVLKKYSREPFSLPMPRKAEVESDLNNEANHKFFSLWKGNSSLKRKFVADSLDEEYNIRVSDWDELKVYHDAIQTNIETQTNKAYQQEYDSVKKSIEDELYGDEAYVNKKLIEVSTALNNKLPFDLTLEVDYDKPNGVIDATVSLPSLLYIPDKKITPLSSGKISVKDKLKREIETDTVNTLLGLSYYLAGYLFNLSVNINIVRLSVMTGYSAYYWVEFDRKSFSAISFSSLYPLQDFFNHPNVIDYKKSTIEFISENVFRARVADAIKASVLLSSNPNLIVLSLADAEKICKVIAGADDLKQAIEEAKTNNTTSVVANKRYRNILNEIYGIATP